MSHAVLHAPIPVTARDPCPDQLTDPCVFPASHAQVGLNKWDSIQLLPMERVDLGAEGEWWSVVSGGGRVT